MSETINLTNLAKHYSDEESARTFFEKMRWPNGPVCAHCSCDQVYRLTPKEGSKRPGRKGLLKCKECRKQFTVTKGTIFEDSHIPLHKWLLAIHLLCSSKKGMSAHQIHRMLGITYKSAWFMMHRIRYSMTQEPLASKLQGTVEMDETYVGGKFKNMHASKREEMKSRHGFGKAPVVTLVERGGNVRSFPVENVTSVNLKEIVKRNVQQQSNLFTDGSSPYFLVEKDYNHESVNHSVGEYVRNSVHTNTVEGYFSLLKRGIIGTYHHVSTTHLHRYTTEFDFRYNRRKTKDGERTVDAIKSAEGKRLYYKEPVQKRS